MSTFLAIIAKNYTGNLLARQTQSNNENGDALGILIQIGLEKMTHLQDMQGSDQSSRPDHICNRVKMSFSNTLASVEVLSCLLKMT